MRITRMAARSAIRRRAYSTLDGVGLPVRTTSEQQYWRSELPNRTGI